MCDTIYHWAVLIFWHVIIVEEKILLLSIYIIISRVDNGSLDYIHNEICLRYQEAILHGYLYCFSQLLLIIEYRLHLTISLIPVLNKSVIIITNKK